MGLATGSKKIRLLQERAGRRMQGPLQRLRVRARYFILLFFLLFFVIIIFCTAVCVGVCGSRCLCGVYVSVFV